MRPVACIAGFGDQRLAVLATCREESRAAGDPLHIWLADMRRMPGFVEVGLGRLGLTDTEAQISGLLGRAVDLGFASQVHERSGGNPYLTELLVRGLSGTELTLPETAPAELRNALLANWHGLSATARQATRVLAVGGRPVEVEVLAAVASEHGVSPAALSRCLAEADEHGVVQPDPDGRPWFRHPLLAEVLYDGMPPGEAARVHATYAQVLESRSAGMREGSAADLAIHSQRAGRIDESYRWSLVAGEHAAELQRPAEEAIHLERACALWDRVSPQLRGSPAQRVDLLRRASRVCLRVGRSASAVGLVEQALRLVDRRSDPLLTSTLLVAWSQATRQRSVIGKTVVGELLDAVRLSQAYPDSPEHALALAALASAQSWDDRYDEAATHAEQAVLAAHRSGSDRALAAALSARALVHLTQRASTSLADAQEAARLARACGATDIVEEAATWQVHCLQHLDRTDEATTIALEAFHDVRTAGSEWAYVLASQAADGLLTLGRWQECRDLLRTALAARCTGIPGASVRLTATLLAARCGRVAEAKLHLDRSRELISEDYAGLHWELTVASAEYLLAAEEPGQALDWLLGRIVVPDAARPTQGEGLLPIIAQAAAETVQAARDAGDAARAAVAIAALENLIDSWPVEPFTTPRPDVAYQAMARALFAAEVARCRAEPNQAALWRQAAETCHAAGTPWEEAVASLRCAEAMIAAGSAASAVGGLLRSAHHTAVQLGAYPLQRQVETLARIKRITLGEPDPIVAAPALPHALAGLTAREREILVFLVAGRTYAEIAKELVISEKTVSVHVSNILRKTQTSSRAEAAALAERLSRPATTPDPRHSTTTDPRPGAAVTWLGKSMP
jgi:DNA-binding NarL/FixJ family response regulator